MIICRASTTHRTDLQSLAMRFPIDDLLSNQECCRYLREQLHPDGLSCPNGHELPDDRSPHDRKQAPILNYRCPECGRVFNILTDTVWEKTHYSCSEIVLVLRGIAKGVSTQALADELDRDYSMLLERRHRIQAAIRDGEAVGLPDGVVETDAMHQNAGEKSRSAPQSG